MKILTLLLLAVMPFYIYGVEGGYVNRLSFIKGDTINFHISTQVSPFNISILRYTAESEELVHSINNINGGERTVPGNSYLYGAGWPVSASLVIPDNWKSGAYRATFMTSAVKHSVIFYIREKQPGSFSKILVISSTNTFNAYNNFGGKSLYNYNSTDTQRSYKVSFLRPSSLPSSFDKFRDNELFLVRWLLKENTNVEYASNYDLYKEPGLLNNYKVVIVSGHNEYWSHPERTRSEQFLRNGGKMMILSGNSVWWQVRYEDNGNTLVCYKDENLDPYYGVVDSLVTVNFYDAPVNKPENSFTGTSFLSGGYVNSYNILPSSQGYGGYSVYNSHHWVYKGTGLQEGDIFGYEEAIAGNEVDGAKFTYVNGIPVFTGEDNSPLNYRVLAQTPAVTTMGYTNNPRGFMGIFNTPGGGIVFNAATIFWNRGLASNYYVQTITRNVLSRFLNNKVSPDIYSWEPFVIKNKSIMNEQLQLNIRNIYQPTPANINFSVNAANPLSDSLDYEWTLNGSAMRKGKTANIQLNSPMQSYKFDRVKVNVINISDTVSLSWNILKTQFAIISEPPAFVKTNTEYFHRLNVFNNSESSVTYSLIAPSWLTVNSKGEVTGTPTINGSFPVSFIARNQQGLSDTLSINLLVNPAVSVEEANSEITQMPNDYTLEQNYPNPFNPSTTIKFGFAKQTGAVLKVFDAMGNEVKELFNGYTEAGKIYEIYFDASSLASGVYIYRLTGGSISEIRKMLLLK